MKLELTWEIIRLGWIGPGDFLRQLSIEDINKFAEYHIIETTGEQLRLLSELCITKNEDEISNILYSLAPKISNEALRGWRMILLKETLDNLPDDPLNGLIALTDFWAKFRHPTDSPHIIQGVINNIPPVEYYTPANFKNIISKHKSWIENELMKLQKGKNRGPSC